MGTYAPFANNATPPVAAVQRLAEVPYETLLHMRQINIQVAATASTAGSLAASVAFSLSISHGEEIVGNGRDTALAGHDSSFKDGPATSFGHPGPRNRNRADNIVVGREGKRQPLQRGSGLFWTP